MKDAMPIPNVMGPTPLPLCMDQMPVPGPVCAILSTHPQPLQNWNERRAYFWSRREIDRETVVFIGDSITELWVDLPSRFPGIPIANRGIGSDSTAGVRFRLKEDVLDLKPRGVVLLLGTNDLAMAATAESTASGLEAILDQLFIHGHAIPVIIGNILPRTDVKISVQTSDLNRMIGLIAENRSLRFVDMHAALCDGSRIRNECFLDGAHPNHQGYERMYAALAPAMQVVWTVVA
jgi:lysophospholipase L1-like esterase